MRAFLITAVDNIKCFHSLYISFPPTAIIGNLKYWRSWLFSGHFMALQISPFYFISNIKQPFLLCPLHNCHRHLKPYVPVCCTPWTSAECQKYGLQKILHDVALHPRQRWDGNLPRKLGNELTVAFSLLESPWWCFYHLCSCLHLSGLFRTWHQHFSGKNQMIDMQCRTRYLWLTTLPSPTQMI